MWIYFVKEQPLFVLPFWLYCLCIIYRPHRSTTYADATYCCRRSSLVSVVCLSVGLSRSWSLQKDWNDRDAVWGVDSSWPRWESWSPCEGALLRRKWAANWKVYEQSAVICTKTAEPIEMPFGMWTQVEVCIRRWFTLAPPGEDDWIVHMGRRCGFLVKLLWPLVNI